MDHNKRGIIAGPLRLPHAEQQQEGDGQSGKAAHHEHVPPPQRSGQHAADDGAVLRRVVIDEIGRLDPPGAGHVLEQDRGFARNVLGQMARDGATGRIIAAARGRALDVFEPFALVEIRDCIGLGRPGAGPARLGACRHPAARWLEAPAVLHLNGR